jgi:SAM-dependent MidA family methyltransferase
MKMPENVIREEIVKCGTISFARFMELALYCPETGYYEANKDTVGRAGDFITSVSVGSLFGELLAFQFAQWLEALPGSDGGWRLIEAGAHDGKLAQDILNWFQTHAPRRLEQMEYVLVEPSATRQEWQRERLRAFAPRVRWCGQIEDASLASSRGLIFSNELLDAFPVHRFGWDAANKKWFEWGVTQAGDVFGWERIPPTASVQGLCPPELAAVLPDNYTLETCPAAEAWWRAAAGQLAQGRLLALDYGLAGDERFSPARPQGTLRAYRQHRLSGDLLANPGEQDLTAHVNFSAVQAAGEAVGLRTDQFCTQPQFLTRILQSALAEKSFAPMTAKQVRQFQMLTHPDHLGRAFRVLVQER